MKCSARGLVRIFVLAVPAFAADVKRTAPVVQITFNRDIAPIIYRHCSACHKPGESGPFSLLSYDDVKRHARQIADVTSRRYMPPWLPEAGYGEFIEERRLTEADIALIQEWVKQGSPSGPPSNAPPSPATASEWTLGKPDLVLHVNQPYQLSAG